MGLFVPLELIESINQLLCLALYLSKLIIRIIADFSLKMHFEVVRGRHHVCIQEPA